MREIKFRCWVKSEKIMYPIASLNWDNAYFIRTIDGDVDGWQRDESDCELMQYTGLKDRNGKEIYESDLVKYIGYDGMEGEYVVEWKHGGFWLFNTDGTEPDWEFNPFTSDEGKDMEVIGNIYENPELLKERTP